MKVTTTFWSEKVYEFTQLFFIERNGLELPFGKFAFWYKKKSFLLYREFKIKRNAYKYMANQIKVEK